MGWTPTLCIAAAALVLGLFCGWRGARPPDLRRGPRMIPWRPLMVACGTVFVLMLAHIGGLLGVAQR